MFPCDPTQFLDICIANSKDTPREHTCEQENQQNQRTHSNFHNLAHKVQAEGIVSKFYGISEGPAIRCHQKSIYLVCNNVVKGRDRTVKLVNPGPEGTHHIVEVRIQVIDRCEIIFDSLEQVDPAVPIINDSFSVVNNFVVSIWTILPNLDIPSHKVTLSPA